MVGSTSLAVMASLYKMSHLSIGKFAIDGSKKRGGVDRWLNVLAMDEWLIEIIELAKHQTRVWKIVCIILTVILILSNVGWLFLYNGKEINHDADNTDSVATNMVISDYVATELEYFRQNCNFTELELAVFNRRAKGMSLELIAEELGYSFDHIRKISVKVNKKILRVL